MKALSIHQPWADLEVAGDRTLEIRKWTTPYRGLLLIHAGLAVEVAECTRLRVIPSATGALIGSAELTSIELLDEQKWGALRPHHLEAGPRCYGNNTYGWFLNNARRFPRPILFKGVLGIFNVPDDILTRHKYKVLKDGKAYESLVPGRYAGWAPGKIFGRLDCKSGTRMKEENRVFFISWEDAIAEGYRPCKNCKPARDD